jgi:IS5 family transposase
MTRRKRVQRTLWEGVVDEDVRALWEPWMVEADKLLDDDELIDLVWAAQSERHEQSATRGRPQTPAEIALRLLLLKHVRNWGFETLEREVRMNLAYREFTRIGLAKVPDATALARIAQALGGEVIAQLQERLVTMAQQKGALQGRRMRVDTTVVETNIHYPTDSSLLGDGARVLTRTMKKIERQAGRLKRKVRDRTRSVNKRVRAIAMASRQTAVGSGAPKETVSRVAALFATDSQRQPARGTGSGTDVREAKEGTAPLDKQSIQYGRARTPGSEADQGASVSRHHADAGQGGQLV